MQIDLTKDKSILMSDIDERKETINLSLIEWFDIIIDLNINREQAKQIVNHLNDQFKLNETK